MGKAKKKETLLRYQYLRLLTERVDQDGNKIPFRLRCSTLKGEIIDQENVVTTAVDVRRKLRNVKFLDSGQIRTIHDSLVLYVDNVKIVAT